MLHSIKPTPDCSYFLNPLTFIYYVYVCIIMLQRIGNNFICYRFKFYLLSLICLTFMAFISRFVLFCFVSIIRPKVFIGYSAFVDP